MAIQQSDCVGNLLSSPKMPFCKPFSHLFRFLSTKVKPPVGVRWPEEPLDHGGFYNASLGAILNSRYKVVRKLGWGQHANVWLALDVKKSGFFAIKILTAYATKAQSRVVEELGILKHITQRARTSDHPGRSHVVTLQESFELESAHGRHLCLVQQALGTFPALLQHGKKLPLQLVKHVSRQLLEALDFLHSQCRVIHTDIKPDNILIARDGMDKFIKSDNLPPAVPTDSQLLPENAILSNPLTVFTPTELANLSEVPKFDVLLTDYGTSAFEDGAHVNLIQPYALRSPEVILGGEWGASADVWNLGCLIFEFLTGRWLFVPRAGDIWTAEQYHLAHMPGVVKEDFDVSYYKQAERFHNYFSEDEGQLYIRGKDVVSLQLALKRYGVISDDDVDGIVLVEFLRSMLRLKPSDRATAGELLSHKWLSS